MLGTITITNSVPVSGTHEAISVTEMILEGGTVFVTDKVFPFEIAPLGSDTVDVEFDNITHTGLYSETATFTIVGVSSGDSYDLVNTIDVIDSSTGDVVDVVLSSGIRTKNVADYATEAGVANLQYLNDQLTAITSNPDDDANAVFVNYDETGTSVWETFAHEVDLSGVSWKFVQAGTLITDQHIVWAEHYTANTGVSIPFIDSEGGYHNRYVVDESDKIALNTHANINVSDGAVARLNEPLPSNVKVYPILIRDGLPDADAVSAPVVYTSQDQHVWVHEVVGIDAPGLMDDVAGTHGFKSGYTGHDPITGDSGHPAFVLVDGELALFTTHSTSPTANEGEGCYYGDAVYVNALNDLVTQLGHD